MKVMVEVEVEEIAEQILQQLAESGDVIQIVRCKDCVHYRKSDKGHPDCDWCKRMICGTIKPDFFCADGERKEI